MSKSLTESFDELHLFAFMQPESSSRLSKINTSHKNIFLDLIIYLNKANIYTYIKFGFLYLFFFLL